MLAFGTKHMTEWKNYTLQREKYSGWRPFPPAKWLGGRRLVESGLGLELAQVRQLAAGKLQSSQFLLLGTHMKLKVLNKNGGLSSTC